ncbi:putative poly(beta-D-mannuronate) O-acetylase [Fibrella aestuarina BUZ 2]|uniref:Putative poly(Beta-D-mannuronate) O-acetylase n=1 Tax=Fibrella aestuarina BUZ 2 TaxID=1166018 RepID=I0K1P8_9BACT|nr:putative poly(beta-D-mannuronate) O-acetylase [Fibrella aestuarina BUZ 2]
MLFNSLHFLLFFTLVTLLFFSLSGRKRVGLLLLASCYFYAAYIPAYLLILFLVIAIDYQAGLWIEASEGKKRRNWLIASLVANVALLAFFKYYDFANDNITYLLERIGYVNPLPSLSLLAPGIVLPIGLSFHTFQSMSYTIEVYRGNQKAERSLAHYALYVLFYPQLVAGPIERPQNVLPQLHDLPGFNWARVRSGLLMMAGGMFKKVVIADRLALLVDPAFGHVNNTNGTSLLIAAVAYSIQIYCDFSGYSDIAIGAGRVMGVRMMENFRTPYLATSVTDFWRRWHISLSTWFRDYVYIPLGGNRKSPARTYLNTLTIFGLSGLWHGASWKFVFWGLLHGFMLIIEQRWRRYRRDKQAHLTKVEQAEYALQGASTSLIAPILTFAFVTLAWIFFRANSFADAGLIIKKIATDHQEPIRMALSQTELLFAGGLVLLLRFEPYWIELVDRVSARVFWVAFPLLAVVCYFFGVFTSNQFIYFQF